MNKTFSPEFLNRIDEVVMFDSLNKEAMHEIIDVELNKFGKRIADLGFTLEVTDAAKDFIVSHGFDEQYGARPLRRSIQQCLEDPLAETLLREQVEGKRIISVDFEENNDKLSISLR